MLLWFLPLCISQSLNCSSVSKSARSFFSWPISPVVVSQNFKEGGRRRHAGIDLSAPRGTLIHAAHPGRVIYAGSGYKGYGKLVIIEYNDRWATFYSHCQKFFVKEGDSVEQGAVVAAVGRTGRATSPHLHFEIRRDKIPINPLDFLPTLGEPPSLAARD